MGEPLGRHLLIVEDDDTLRGVLRDWLREQGFSVVEAADGAGFRRAFREHAIDLVLLDLVLPDMDGLVLLRELRSHSAVPVFVISSRCEDAVRLEALEMTANDYITKPFNLRELELRIRNFFDWSSGANSTRSAAESRLGPWTLDSARRMLRHCDGRTVRLTPAEMELLRTLLDNAGIVVSRTQLLDAVARDRSEITPETLTVLVYRLRRKLSAEGSSATLITTVPGLGYRLQCDGAGP